MIAQNQATTVDTLARLVGSHGNTVREHLATLSAAGLVQRGHAPPSGRGRPRWHYLPTAASTASGSAYEGLALSLAEQLRRASNDPRGAAVEAGERWGSDLVSDTDPKSGVRRRVLTVLDQLGFDPDPEDSGDRVRLRSCPLLGAAQTHPDVVCSVHLGVMRGVVRSAGGNPDDVELLPFFEPDACHLEVTGNRAGRNEAVDNVVGGTTPNR